MKEDEAMEGRLSHTIQYGDTLQSIATEKLHDVSMWTRIASLNHLQFPYIVRTERQKSKNPLHWLTAGDKIYLPTRNTDNNPLFRANTNSAFSKHVYDDVIGMDLKLGYNQRDSPAEGNTQGDQVCYLDENSDQDDIATVSGISELLQSLTTRLITDRGTLPYHPSYGSVLNKFIGRNTYPGMAEDISDEIKRTLYTDPRVIPNGITIKFCRLYNENFFAEVEIQPIRPYNKFSIDVYSISGDQIDTAFVH